MTQRGSLTQLSLLDIKEPRTIALADMGRVRGYTPHITHIYHPDPEKDFHGLPTVVHISVERLTEILAAVKPGQQTITFTEDLVDDYEWELKNQLGV